MLGWLLGLFGDDTIREEFENRDLFEGVSDDRLKEVCEERAIPRYQDPVDRLEDLPDERGHVYAWITDSPEKRRRWLDTLAEYQDRYGAFNAVHTVLLDTDELHRLDKDELEPYL